MRKFISTKLNAGILFFGIFSFWTTFCGIAHSQSSLSKNVNDSLWGIWKNESFADTVRLSALDVFIWEGYIFTKPDSAIRYSEIMRDFAIQKKVTLYEGLGITNIGMAWYIKGDYKNAMAYFNEGLVIFERINHQKFIATTLNRIGNIYKNTSEYKTALEIYSRSLAIETSIGNKGGMAITLNNIGAVYMYQGDFPPAMDYFMRSLKLAQEIDNKKSIANASGNIGIVYKNLGDYEKALEFYTIGLTIQQEIDDKKGIANSLNNLGTCYKIMKNYEKAIQCFQQSLEIQGEYGNQQGKAVALFNMAIIYTLDWQYDTALVLCEQSLKIQEAIGDKRGMANTLGNMAYLYRDLGDYEKAVSCGQKSFEMAVSLGMRHETKVLARALYQIHLLAGKFDIAQFYLFKLKEQVLESIEINYFTLTEREKELYFVSVEEDFMRYFDFTSVYQKEQPALCDTAYNLALTNKGLALKSSTAMRQSIFESGDTALINQYETWRALKQKISKLYSNGKDTKELEQQANDLEKELVKNSTAFSDFDKIKNLDWRNVQAGLNDDDAAIEFVHFLQEVDKTRNVGYAALVVTKKSVHPVMVNLCSEAELIEILGVFQGNNLGFINNVYGTKAEAKTALYKKIWQPLEIHLEGIKNVYLSPTGLLHKISFAALTKDNDIYLCDLYNLHQQSSTGKVAFPENSIVEKSDFFTLIGGVKYSSKNSEKEIWEYLPGTLKETNNITSILKKKKIGYDYFSGEMANEETFKTMTVKSNILHIATHGYFYADPDAIETEMSVGTEEEGDLVFRGANTNYAAWNFVKNKNPLMRSGIILANSNDVWDRDPTRDGEDGILTASEVSNLDLRNTKLVVLSACETGLGDIKGSEGVYGLQRAFKMAGVKFIIMSLWQVPDKETAEFMTLFYKKLIKYQEIHIAFSQTQKAMRKKYDPYYWAAFVLIE